MKKIVIVGSGGLAKEIAFLIKDINKIKNEWQFNGFIDNKVGKNNGEFKVYQNDEWLMKTNEELHVVFGIGDPQLLSKLHLKFKQNKNLKYPNLIHPNVIADWGNIAIGIGNIICAGTILTTDISIASFNLFNLNVTIGHDTKIGNYNIFNPTVNISGGIKIQNRILVGTGAQVLQYLSIDSDSIIGAGSVVTKNIIDKGIYVGVPAKKLNK